METPRMAFAPSVDLVSVPFDEGEDFELDPASRTAKRIRFVHLLDERGPPFASLPCRGRSGRSCGARSRRRLPLGSLAPSFVRIPPVIPDQVLPGVRNMLGDFGQEIQRVENLEVARGTREPFLLARFGESAHGIS
jgi:hypothetical protein